MDSLGIWWDGHLARLCCVSALTDGQHAHPTKIIEPPNRAYSFCI